MTANNRPMTIDKRQATTASASPYDSYYEAGNRVLTWDTIGGEAIFTDIAPPHLLQLTWERNARREGAQVKAFVVLPDHVHLLLVPSAVTNWERFTQATQRDFDAAYQVVQGLPEPALVWETGFRLERIEDSNKFAVWLDVIHYDPVHHGLVKRPEEWPHSSYAQWVERQVYHLGWGWERPQRLMNLHA